MSELTIRQATHQDIPDLNRLLYQVQQVHHEARPDLFKAGAKKYTDEELEQLLNDPQRPIFVAVTNDQIQGYVFLESLEQQESHILHAVKTLYIDDLCVDKQARGQHIGSQLYAFVIDYAKQKGYYHVTLNVWADNQKALGFYEKLGLHPQKIGMDIILE